MTPALRLTNHSAGLILNESILIGSQKIFDKYESARKSWHFKLSLCILNMPVITIKNWPFSEAGVLE